MRERVRVREKGNHKMPHKHTTTFLRQFATLIAAGIPINEALHTLAATTTHPALKSLITDIQTNLQKGLYLSQAMKRFPKQFDSITLSLIRLAEQTGTLDSTLLSLANTLEQQLETRRKIQQALFYPAIITCTSIVMLLIMLLYIIPHFQELFVEHEQQLPLLTRMIFRTADIAYYATIPFFSMLILSIIIIKRSNMSIRLPLLHTYQHNLILTRFARHLALCLKSGLPLIHALTLVIQPDKYPDFAYYIYHLRRQLHAGQTLYQAMQRHNYFPPLMLQMVKTGEETGKLDQMLDKIADLYENDTNHRLKQLGQLLEPLIMVILGVLIGGLVIGMYLPVFKLGSTL